MTFPSHSDLMCTCISTELLVRGCHVIRARCTAEGFSDVLYPVPSVSWEMMHRLVVV